MIAKRIPLCPKCRELGLETDCSDRLNHGEQDGVPAVRPETDDPDNYDIEVTLRFPIPRMWDYDADPHEVSTHLRETWLDDPVQFRKVLTEAAESEDFDLVVRPVFMS